MTNYKIAVTKHTFQIYKPAQKAKALSEIPHTVGETDWHKTEGYNPSK